MNCKHEWHEIGQTKTGMARTLINWCILCGALSFSNISWDYRRWHRYPKNKRFKKALKDK